MEILFASHVAMCLHMSLSDNNDTSKLFFHSVSLLWQCYDDLLRYYHM